MNFIQKQISSTRHWVCTLPWLALTCIALLSAPSQATSPTLPSLYLEKTNGSAWITLYQSPAGSLRALEKGNPEAVGFYRIQEKLPVTTTLFSRNIKSGFRTRTQYVFEVLFPELRGFGSAGPANEFAHIPSTVQRLPLQLLAEQFQLSFSDALLDSLPSSTSIEYSDYQGNQLTAKSIPLSQGRAALFDQAYRNANRAGKKFYVQWIQESPWTEAELRLIENAFKLTLPSIVLKMTVQQAQFEFPPTHSLDREFLAARQPHLFQAFDTLHRQLLPEILEQATLEPARSVVSHSFIQTSILNQAYFHYYEATSSGVSSPSACADLSVQLQDHLHPKKGTLTYYVPTVGNLDIPFQKGGL